jgi:NSS family neurotransmitter:Na+ symporter
MAKVSPSGLLTLMVLIFIGPLVYLGRFIYFKCMSKRKKEDADVKHDDDCNVIRGLINHDGDGNSILAESGDDDSVIEKEDPLSSNAYLFALIGYAIGIGNCWRFPYVIATNGGCAAVVAYLICAVFVAWPLFIWELILGQYLRRTFIDAWEAIRPRWLSFGWAQFLLLFITQSYFSVVITYTLPYIVSSCQEPLPWTDGTTSEEFWKGNILNQYDNLNDKPPGPGPIVPHLAIALFVFWVITFFSVAFGKKILAKITYVTVIMPVVLMIILVIFSVQQPGASEGIRFYIGKFEASELRKAEVWATALGQILFSLSPGFGTAITYSSFVSRKEDVYKAGMVVCVANSAFSVLGGFAIFAIVGSLAANEGVPVEEVATRSGTGLAFITIAQAMTYFGSWQNVMSVLFYVMLLTLGLDSSYAWTETLVSTVGCTLKKRKREVHTHYVTLFLCIIMFLFGLVFTTRMGNEILDVIDMFVGTIFLLAACFLESMILNLDFGFKRLGYALKAATYETDRFPTGRNLFPKWLCLFDFRAAVPLSTGILGIWKIVSVAMNPYEGYPQSLLAWGWTLLAICVSIVPVTIWKRQKSELPAMEEDPIFRDIFSAEVNAEDDEESPSERSK